MVVDHPAERKRVDDFGGAVAGGIPGQRGNDLLKLGDALLELGNPVRVCVRRACPGRALPDHG